MGQEKKIKNFRGKEVAGTVEKSDGKTYIYDF